MRTEKRKVNELRFYPNNPRKIDKRTFEKLMNSIKEFGNVEPLVINPNNEVIGGNQRLKVLRELGINEVDVVIVDLPKSKEKALNLALNRIQGEWDEDLLKSFIEGIESVDLELTGFDIEEIREIDDTGIEATDDGYEPEKDITTNIKPGDVYQLGRHRLVCGDALNFEDVSKLTKDRVVSVVFCDPPYNIGLNYYNGITAKKKYSPQGFRDDNKSYEEYKEFIHKSIANALRISKRDVHIFYWCDQKYIGLIQNLYNEMGIEIKRVALWIKNHITPTPQVAFNKCYEPCIYGTVGKPKLNDKVLNLTEILNKDVMLEDIVENLFSIIDIWPEPREDVLGYMHPTQKPVTVYERPLKRVSFEGDIVLDLFGGSGSLLMACEQLNRTAYVMEIDPYYCQVIIDRWEKFTSDKAVRLDGE